MSSRLRNSLRSYPRYQCSFQKLYLRKASWNHSQVSWSVHTIPRYLLQSKLQSSTTLVNTATSLSLFLQHKFSRNNNWDSAKRNCQQEQANLVVIDDLEENVYLYEMAQEAKVDIWIGYTYEVRKLQWVANSSIFSCFVFPTQNGDYHWLDGFTSTYSNWADDEPKYAHIYHLMIVLLLIYCVIAARITVRPSSEWITRASFQPPLSSQPFTLFVRSLRMVGINTCTSEPWNHACLYAKICVLMTRLSSKRYPMIALLLAWMLRPSLGKVPEPSVKSKGWTLSPLPARLRPRPSMSTSSTPESSTNRPTFTSSTAFGLDIKVRLSWSMHSFNECQVKKLHPAAAWLWWHRKKNSVNSRSFDCCPHFALKWKEKDCQKRKGDNHDRSKWLQFSAISPQGVVIVFDPGPDCQCCRNRVARKAMRKNDSAWHYCFGEKWVSKPGQGSIAYAKTTTTTTLQITIALWPARKTLSTCTYTHMIWRMIGNAVASWMADRSDDKTPSRRLPLWIFKKYWDCWKGKLCKDFALQVTTDLSPSFFSWPESVRWFQVAPSDTLSPSNHGQLISRRDDQDSDDVERSAKLHRQSGCQDLHGAHRHELRTHSWIAGLGHLRLGPEFLLLFQRQARLFEAGMAEKKVCQVNQRRWIVPNRVTVI